MTQELVLDITEDKEAPVFSGATLRQLEKEWKQQSQSMGKSHFSDITPLQNIALIGAVRHHKNGKLGLRDELSCRAIIQDFIRNIPIAKDCNITLYNLAEGNDIFKTTDKYDMAVFCNIRDILPSLMDHYQALNTHGKLSGVLDRQRQPIGSPDYIHDADRAVSDALQPSDILSGVRFSRIPHEHTYYVTVSEQAMHDDAYRKLLSSLDCRYVASWGFRQFINGRHFASPSVYDLSQPLGYRLQSPGTFTLTQQPACNSILMAPYWKKAATVMPHKPFIDLAVRNDILEKIANTEKDNPKTSILFKNGIELIEKLELMAHMQQARGRHPKVASWRAEEKLLTTLQEKAAKPLNFIERAERSIRNILS